MNLDLTDWMKIRTGDYWGKRDLLQGVEQIKFVYKKVTDYLG